MFYLSGAGLSFKVIAIFAVTCSICYLIDSDFYSGLMSSLLDYLCLSRSLRFNFGFYSSNYCFGSNSIGTDYLLILISSFFCSSILIYCFFYIFEAV